MEYTLVLLMLKYLASIEKNYIELEKLQYYILR